MEGYAGLLKIPGASHQAALKGALCMHPARCTPSSLGLCQRLYPIRDTANRDSRPSSHELELLQLQSKFPQTVFFAPRVDR
jgi:hypothetical protein